MDELEKLYNKLGENDKAFLSQGLDAFKAKIASNKDYQEDMVALAYSYGFDHNKILGEVKKKEPTQSSFLGGALGSQKPNQVVQPNVGVPTKPKVSNTFEESIGGQFGGLNTESATKYNTEKKPLSGAKTSIDQFTSSLKPYSNQFDPKEKEINSILTPLYESKDVFERPTNFEARQLGDKLMFEKDKQEFAQSNPTIPQEQLDQVYQSEVEKRKANDLIFKAEKESKENSYGYEKRMYDDKSVEIPKATWFGLMPEGNTIQFMSLDVNPYLTEDEQLAAAVALSPQSGAEFKRAFKENKPELVEMFKYMDKNQKADIKLKLQTGKYDQFNQYEDISNFLNGKIQSSVNDLDLLKEREQRAIVLGDYDSAKKFNDESKQVYSEYKNAKEKNQNIVFQMPEVAEKQFSDLGKQILLDNIDPSSKVAASVLDGVSGAFKTALVTLPSSFARGVSNAVLDDDEQKIANFYLNNLNDQVNRIRVAPRQEGFYGMTEDVARTAAEIAMIYGTIAPQLQMGLEAIAPTEISANSGVFATGFAHMYNDEVQNLSKDYGNDMSLDEIHKLAVMKSFVVGSLEGIFPDAKLLDWNNGDFIKDLVTKTIRGKEPFTKVAKEWGIDITKNVGEELAQDLGAAATQNVFSYASDIPKLKTDLLTKDGVVNTSLVTAFATGFISMPKLMQSNMKKDVGYYKGLVTLAESPAEFEAALGNTINTRPEYQDRVNELRAEVIKTQEALTKLPPNLTFDNKSKLAPLIVFKSYLTTQNEQIAQSIVANEQSGLDEVIIANENKKLKEQLGVNEKQIKEINKNIEKIYESDKATDQVVEVNEMVVEKPTFANVPILTRTAEEIETAKNEVFNNLNKLEVGSVIENSDGEIKVITEKSTDKKGNILIGVVTYIRQEDGSLRQMTNIVWASKSADGKIKLDYNPHETGTNSKGERVTVTDQITDKKIDLSKENIFTEDENGNLIQINKVEKPSVDKSSTDETKPINPKLQKVKDELAKGKEKVQSEAQKVFEQKTNSSQKTDVQETGTDKKTEQPQTQKPIVAETKESANKEVISSAVVEGQKLKDPTLSAAEKKKAKDELGKILANNPSVKRIFDNIKEVHKQLVKNNVITKEGDCP